MEKFRDVVNTWTGSKSTNLGRLTLFFLLVSSISLAQSDTLSGTVYGFLDGKEEPLTGASVYWLESVIGTTTDAEGEFKLYRGKNHKTLIISFVGYKSDSILNPIAPINTVLKASNELDEAIVTGRTKTTAIDRVDPRKVEKIGEKELLKAACCSLSESFETNPSVDVSFTDAVTGTRQIQMLGLSGIYAQMTRENIPNPRGLATIQGLTFVPGPWIESIHLNKGAGSVVNGFESITGQIDVNLRNPASMDRWFFNLYGNQMGRLEANIHTAIDVSKNWGSALLLHGNVMETKNDRNNDGFLDMPLSRQLFALNRWEWYNDKGIHLQFGVKGVHSDKRSGQVSFNHDSDKGSIEHWGARNTVNRIEGWMKLGKVFLDKPGKSIGFQLLASHHDQVGYYGQRDHNATQNSLFANFIYETFLMTSNHKLKIGLNAQADDYTESFNSVNYDRNELTAGFFTEWLYSPSDKFAAVAGIRLDQHNIYCSFVSPRIHIRYAPDENSVFRVSGGQGRRTAQVLAENAGIMASNREFLILGDNSDKPFGLNQEVAWNYGLNFTQYFTLDYRDGAISLDFYRTEFINQIIVDRDSDAQTVSFYNLQGTSYSNSFQAQIDYEIINRLDVRIAYRWFDVHTTYSIGELRVPLVAEHRGFVNLAYQTRKYWKFDGTLNLTGEKRIPITNSNPAEYRLEEFSPVFATVNVQISKTWREKFEIYAGVENLTDFRQENPIISADDPFNPFFDASMVWGPIFGRNVYAGLRLNIK
jgi:outer membrane receptor for ferrienterochelin and colicins